MVVLIRIVVRDEIEYGLFIILLFIIGFIYSKIILYIYVMWVKFCVVYVNV